MELSAIKGIGPTRLESLRAVGVCSLRDLLYFLPQRYEDRTHPIPCADANGGEVLVMGVVQDAPKLSRFNGLTRVTAYLWDESGKLPLVWYNQPWMMQNLPVGQTIMLFGRMGQSRGKPVLQNAQRVTEPCILPVYRAVKGIPAKSFREMMQQALEQVDDCCPETLPNDLRIRHQLCELNFAIRQAHFPLNVENLRLARRRLAFEQMLMYQAALGLLRGHKADGTALPIPPDAPEKFWQTLPFPPTGAQKRVLEEIAADLRCDRAMSRLVQGDVGCGKTALAFGAIAMTCACGYQAAMMAPTEILARQHYESAKAMLEPLGIRCGLLIGSMRPKAKREAQEACANGEYQAVFGTHALISEKVAYQRLGLVVTDEQHRFGVMQRSTLQQKGADGTKAPHVLVMSATPIPRTLALILYGDLDVSIVDELPPGRTPVKTRVVPEEKRAGMYGFLRQEVLKGHQAYVVCPLVEDSEMMEDVRSAQATFDALKNGELSGADDFMEEPPKKYNRLFPGNEVRIKGAYIVRCTGCVKDADGNVAEVLCEYDPATRGGNTPDGRKVRGTIHWVDAHNCADAEVRLYDNLFADADPEGDGKDYLECLNPDSLSVLTGCKVERMLAGAEAPAAFQFLRLGYFAVDNKDSAPGHLVFNRAVALKDSFKKA